MIPGKRCGGGASARRGGAFRSADCNRRGPGGRKQRPATLRSLAPMAAAFCRGPVQGKEEAAGWGFQGCGAQETESCLARTPRGSATLAGCPRTPASPGPARAGRQRQMGQRGGLVAGLGAGAGRNKSWAELGKRGGSRLPGGKDKGARADFRGWAWPKRIDRFFYFPISIFNAKTFPRNPRKCFKA
jgi:hypothetical protein